MESKIKIGLVEDQKLFRLGIKAILNLWSQFEVNFESSDGYSVIESLKAQEVIPDIMLVDLTLPPNGEEEFNGWRVVKVLKREFPQIKILILSVHDDDYLIAKLIEEGANGYLVKDSDPQEVHNAIVDVFQKGSYINAQTLAAIQGKLSGKIRPPKAHEQLTKREVEVLTLVCQQMTTEEIAEKLFISSKTVNSHRYNLLQKTQSRNTTGLVMYAVKHRIVELI